MRAVLNEEGKKIWSYVFPDGEVPVKNVLPIKGQVDGNAGPLKDGAVFQAYIVDWECLTNVQKQKILEHFKTRFGGPVKAVLAQIEKDGLPLRANLVSSVAIPGRFF